MIRSFIKIVVLCAAVLGGQAVAQTPQAWTRFSVSEVKPNLEFSGPINAIARNPLIPARLIAASDAGGLFRSDDSGATWRHVDSLPTREMTQVLFWSGNPNVVIAASLRDHAQISVPTIGGGEIRTSGGGIWVSRDGGDTWSRPAAAVPAARALSASGTCPNDYEAYDLSQHSTSYRIFAATTCGVAYSDDGGLTWSHVALPLAVARVNAVEPLTGDIVIAGTSNGVFVSQDRGANWVASTTPLQVTSPHGLARSPYSTTEAFALDGGNNLLFTIDGGATWRGLPNAPGIAACGGIPFIKVTAIGFSTPSARRYVLFHGSRCTSIWAMAEWTASGGMRILPLAEFATISGNDVLAPVRGTLLDASQNPCCFASWALIAGARFADPRDLLLDQVAAPIGQPMPAARPSILTSDGGIERFFADGSVRAVGSGPNGVNALQLFDVSAQRIDSERRVDLYFSTWHNSLWGSSEGRSDWPDSRSAEGYLIDVERHVPDPSASTITYQACMGCATYVSRPRFADERNWPDPTSADIWAPYLIARRVHVQPVPLPGVWPPPFSGFSVTRNLGANWTFYPLPSRIPQSNAPAAYTFSGFLDVVHGRNGAPVGHHALHIGTQRMQVDFDGASIPALLRWGLFRLNFLPTAGYAPLYTFPRMTDFGSLGAFQLHASFAGNPQDPMHLIAADVGRMRMATSTSGGDTWQPLNGLTNLLLDNENRRFARFDGNGWTPNASTIGFNHLDPNLVLVGTVQGGALFLRRPGPDLAVCDRLVRDHRRDQNRMDFAQYSLCRDLGARPVAARNPAGLRLGGPAGNSGRPHGSRRGRTRPVIRRRN